METAITVSVLLSIFIAAYFLGQARFKEKIKSDEAAKKKIKEDEIAANHARRDRIKSMLNNQDESTSIVDKTDLH